MCDLWIGGVSLHPWSSVLAAFHGRWPCIAGSTQKRVESGHLVHAHWLLRRFRSSDRSHTLRTGQRRPRGGHRHADHCTAHSSASSNRGHRWTVPDIGTPPLRTWPLRWAIASDTPFGLDPLDWRPTSTRASSRRSSGPEVAAGSRAPTWKVPLRGRFRLSRFLLSQCSLFRTSASAASSTRRGLLQPRTIRALLTVLATLGAGLATVRWFVAKINTDGAGTSLIQKPHKSRVGRLHHLLPRHRSDRNHGNGNRTRRPLHPRSTRVAGGSTARSSP